MKEKFTKTLLLLPLLIFVMASCSDDEPEFIHGRPLLILNSHYNVPINANRFIEIQSGNGNYSFSVENKDVLSVAHEKNEEREGIRLIGLKEGKTKLTVKDELSKMTQNLEINVTARYLNISLSNIFQEKLYFDSHDEEQDRISKDIENDLLWEPGYYLVLMGNDGSEKEAKMYVFASFQDANAGKFLHEGTYSLKKEHSNYVLTLNMRDNDTDELREYLISGDYRKLIDPALKFLSDKNVKTNCDSLNLQKIELKENLTDKFKIKYPNLGFAIVTTNAYFSAYEPDVVTIDIK